MTSTQSDVTDAGIRRGRRRLHLFVPALFLATSLLSCTLLTPPAAPAADPPVVVADTASTEPFRITPLRPVEELRRIALEAEPPVEEGSFRTLDLVELQSLDSTIRYDIRYATENNFMGARFYTSAHAFMQRAPANALARAHRALAADGVGLIVYDAYRPWHVTKMFWDATSDSLKDFVADPAAGSRHNRGAAVDVGLYHLATGAVLPMPSGYDEFTARAHAEYAGGTEEERRNRALLRRALEREGFQVLANEWWHFDYANWREYPILNLRFEEIGAL